MEKKLTKAPTFIPGMNYEWKEEDEFVLKGLEFSALYNTLKEHLERPGGVAIARLVEIQGILQKLFITSIESGIVTPILPKKDNLLQEAIQLGKEN